VVGWDRGIGERLGRPTIPALAGVVAAALLLTQRGSWIVLLAAAIAAGASLIPVAARTLGAALQVVLILVAIGLVATDQAWRLDGQGRAVLAAAALAVVVGCIASSAHGGHLSLLAPLLVAMGGLFLALPDTEPPLLVAAVLAPVVVAVVVTRSSEPVRPFPDVGAAAPALVLVAVAAGGAPVDASTVWHLPAETVGGVACAGVLLAWPAARVVVWTGPGLPRVPWPVLAVLQIPAVVVISRLGVVRQTATTTLRVSATVLLVLLVVLVVAEVLVARLPSRT
jgi:hypothetical protein